MKYRIEEYKLKNGIEDISIIFDEKYQLLTLLCHAMYCPLKNGLNQVLIGTVREK